jgi:hypothetical protein
VCYTYFNLPLNTGSVVNRTLLTALAATLLLGACDDAGSPQIFDPEPAGEGVSFDEDNPGADVEGKADGPHTYVVPTDLPRVERPEIIVSLKTLTVHFFDRSTGVSRVYPTGPGKLGSSGRSWTPAGFFETWHDASDRWGYIERRTSPDYFGGFPFLRLNTLNSRGQMTYGFHGPITYTCPGSGDCPMVDREWFLVQDYVSSGCMRMESEDIVEMFWAMRDIPRVPVAIFDDYERDAAGRIVDLGSDPVLWQPGESIQYGECGAREDPWVAGKWGRQRCR